MSAKSFPFLNGDCGVSLGIPSGALGDSWGGLGDTLGGLGGSSGALRESLGGQEASDLIAWGPGSVRGLHGKSSEGPRGSSGRSRGKPREQKIKEEMQTKYNRT